MNKPVYKSNLTFYVRVGILLILATYIGVWVVKDIYNLDLSFLFIFSLAVYFLFISYYWTNDHYNQAIFKKRRLSRLGAFISGAHLVSPMILTIAGIIFLVMSIAYIFR